MVHGRARPRACVALNHRRSGVTFELPPLPVSYRDYSICRRSAAFGAQFEQQLDFWRLKLSALPTVDLPTDHPRPRVWTTNGSYHERQIPATLFEQLTVFPARRLTLFMSTFAAFAVLLRRLTGQTDIPIGVPVANRTHSALEGLVGTFVNTLVLRNDLSGDPTFETLLRRVRATALEAFARQDVPFDRLVQEIGQRGDRSRAPLAQVMFNVTNAPMHGIAIQGVDWEPVELDRGGAQFELSFSVRPPAARSMSSTTRTFSSARPSSAGLRNTSRCSRPWPRRATLPISALPPSPAEESSTLAAWNATRVDYPQHRPFPRLLSASAAMPARHGDHLRRRPLHLRGGPTPSPTQSRGGSAISAWERADWRRCA